MGKRRHAYIILSDDEDADDEARHSPSIHKKPPLAPQVEVPSKQREREREREVCCMFPWRAPQGRSLSFQANTDRLESCGPAKRKGSSSIINIEAGSYGDVHSAGHGTITGSQGEKCQFQVPNMQPWTEKYCPKDISDLAVHTKKVANVREWMGTKLQHVDELHTSGNVLILSGPTGAGKTAVVRVLVDLFQVELCEWDPPVPTLWKEHLHHVNADVPYISKVNQFIDFLEKVKKYPGLPLTRVLPDEANKTLFVGSTASRKSKLLLLDDLPIVYGRELASKLCHCLHNFAVSVQFPTIVIATDFLEKEEYGQGTNFLTADLVQALESGGATKISFNPITAIAVKKVLDKIVIAEKCTVPSDSASFIAESCGGDIRHAINSLQFLCIGLNSVSCTWDPGGILSHDPKRRRGTKDGLRRKKSSKCADLSVPTYDRMSSISCRDGVLSLFHALGKVLYNKRLIEEPKDSGTSCINLVLKDDLQRHPLNMEAPEILLSQSHADAASFLHFLHENVLEFVDDEGVEDVSVASTYFSDVDCLLGLKNKGPKVSARFTLPMSDEIDAGYIAEAVAGSVVARGVLFANTHPAKHRWQSIRAPVMRQVDRLSNEKKAELRAKSWGYIRDSLTMVTYSVQATECEPYYSRLSHVFCPTNQPEKFISWKTVSEPTLQTCEDESDLSLPLPQEEDLLPSIMAIDINRIVDASMIMYNSDDEIEEW